MGTCLSGSEVRSDRLKVATLNYCGIMNSPFEFYCDDFQEQLKDITRLFLEVVPEYFPDFRKDNSKFDWKLGKLDVKFRNRYSPMFQLDVGITDSKRIMSSAEFSQEWEKVFSQKISKIEVKYTEEEKERTQKYDMAMWHTLLRYVYFEKNLKDFEKKDANEYIRKLKPFYDLSFLDQQRKSKKVCDNLKRVNADVMFFQQYSGNFDNQVKKMNDYYTSHDATKDTLIIAKKKSFKSKPESTEVVLQHSLGKQLYEKLNWNNRACFLIIDKIIFINAHLSSKAEPNKKNVENMKETLYKVREKMPEYQIVAAGDLNSYVEPFEGFFFFPEGNAVTTVKKRTYTQAQFHKADKIIKQSKDRIISTLNCVEGSISYITGQQPSVSNLVPTNEHPFDHFVVSASFVRQKATNPP